MEYRKVTAIIRRLALERVEKRLIELGVPGITVTKVKGFGEYADFFASDWQSEHVRIEIFVRCDAADALVRAIIDEAHTGVAGDGIVAVLPAETVWRVRTGDQAELALPTDRT